MLPALRNGLGRRVFPPVVIERDDTRAACFFDSPGQHRTDPARHVVTDARPAHGFVRLLLVDPKGHVHWLALLDEAKLRLPAHGLRHLAHGVPPATVACLSDE